MNAPRSNQLPPSPADAGDSTTHGTALVQPELSSAERRALRADAHHLDPVVMIGDSGLTQSVIAEANRALDTHQLIKIRVLGDDREVRAQMMETLCAALGCAPVQIIGKLLIVWRPAKAAKPDAGFVPKKEAARRAANPARGAVATTAKATRAPGGKPARPPRDTAPQRESRAKPTPERSSVSRGGKSGPAGSFRSGGGKPAASGPFRAGTTGSSGGSSERPRSGSRSGGTRSDGEFGRTGRPSTARPGGARPAGARSEGPRSDGGRPFTSRSPREGSAKAGRSSDTGAGPVRGGRAGSPSPRSGRPGSDGAPRASGPARSGPARSAAPRGTGASRSSTAGSRASGRKPAAKKR